MPTSDLRKQHWNQLFSLVKGAGFAPLTEMIRTEVEGAVLGYDFDTVPALFHKPTKFFFAIAEIPPPEHGRWSPRRGPFGIAYAPGEQTPRGLEQYLTWEEVMGACSHWLIRVREDGGPDLWDLAAEDRTLLASVGGGGLENTPFTPVERQRIEETLDHLQAEVIRTQQLTADQTHLLTGMLTEAKAAANRFGRKDWLQFFYGGLIGLAIQAAFAPDQARHLWQAAVQALGWLFQHTPLLR